MTDTPAATPAVYTVPRTIIDLVFADEQYAGLDIKCQALTMGETLDGFDLQWTVDNELDFPTRKAKLGELHQYFIDHLVSWNLAEKDGTPVPPTLEGLRTQEFPFINVIVRTWLNARWAVSAPLERPSDGGAPSELEASIPMEPLSESLAS